MFGGGIACAGMKILLDECVPWPMHRLLAGHECRTAQQQGWGGIKNGELLERAEGEFNLFITSDQNLRYQQNLAGRRIAILELSTNKLRRIESAAALIQTTITALSPDEFRRLEIP
jgi:predicted nuclease of predicted toxin-antitoxin system